MKYYPVFFFIISCIQSDRNNQIAKTLFKNDSIKYIDFIKLPISSLDVILDNGAIKCFKKNDIEFSIVTNQNFEILHFGSFTKKIDTNYYFFYTDSIEYIVNNNFSFLKITVIDKTALDGNTSHILNNIVWLIKDNNTKNVFLNENYEIDWSAESIIIDYNNDGVFETPTIEDNRSINDSILTRLTLLFKNSSIENYYQIYLKKNGDTTLLTNDYNKTVTLYAYQVNKQLYFVNLLEPLK